MIKWIRRLLGSAHDASSGTPAEQPANSSRTDTEFTAEIVRISRLSAHPGADKLELARFEMAGIGETTYEVVTQKGTVKPGDLMAYFSVDCVLPTSHPDFAFLTQRLDGAGKTHFRLRAARLRGIVSQGLLVPPPSNAKFGDQVAELYGVTYYRDAEPEDTRGPTKPTAKPKVQPMPVYGVESLKKVPRLFEEGEAVAITEKIHGTNFRFGWVRRRFLGLPFGWKFVVGSHRVIKDSGGTGHFYGHDVWAQAAKRMKLAEATKKYKGYAFYGELYGYTYDGQKIQDLTYGRRPEDGPGLAIFDVKDLETGCWLTPMDRWDVAHECGLEHAPVLAVIEAYDSSLGRLFEGRGSALDPDTIKEGVVIESHRAPRRKAKYVLEQYLMRKEAS